MVFLLIGVVAENLSQALIAWSILGFSRSFVDFSSSGLENPLTHLLLVVFLVLFIKNEYTLQRLFILSLVACLGTLNRQDCILFYIFPLLYAWSKVEDKRRGVIFIFLGFIPLLLWGIFSVIYYGFPFPNTAYAKLGAGVWKGDLFLQGLRYYQWTWNWDLITLLVIFSGIITAFSRYEPKVWALSVGIILYCIYVLRIGGDFMGSRFFTAPMVVSTFIILRWSRFDRLYYGIPAVLLFLFSSFIQPYVPVFTDSSFGENKKEFEASFENNIGNERMFYFAHSSLVKWRKGKPMPDNGWANSGREYRKENKRMVKQHGAVGSRGYLAGPLVHIVDYYALADPLLARLPSVYRPNWTSGHFGRDIPVGYMESVLEDTPNRIKDPNLAEYYEHLKVVTRGPIWSMQRWIDILKINLGYYDFLIDKDRYRFPSLKKITIRDLETNLSRELSSEIDVPKFGLEVSLDKLCKSKVIELEIVKRDSYVVLFFNETKWIGRKYIFSKNTNSQEFYLCRMKVPLFVRLKGFDKIRIFPYPGGSNSKLKNLKIPV